jgi:hypothetical protein
MAEVVELEIRQARALAGSIKGGWMSFHRCPAASWKTRDTSGRVRKRLKSVHRVSFRGSALPSFSLVCFKWIHP